MNGSHGCRLHGCSLAVYECERRVEQDYHGKGVCNCRLGELRASIPTPDPAVFVAAVDAYGEAAQDVGFGKGAGGWPDGAKTPALDAARAALLALGGVR